VPIVVTVTILLAYVDSLLRVIMEILREADMRHVTCLSVDNAMQCPHHSRPFIIHFNALLRLVEID
jgi:hypothetical protein